MTYPAPSDSQAEEPVTLHRIMQAMIGEGLRERYEPPQRLSHELFVLLMQLREEEGRTQKSKKQKEPRKQKVKKAPTQACALDLAAK
jgi:hypothetical protein